LTGDLETDFGFTGFYRHLISGLTFSLYRAYDANLGRWLSRDPIEESGGLNLYAYADGDPANVIDPLGLAGLSPKCAAALAELREAINSAIQQIVRYNPETDRKGGQPIMRDNKPIGRDTRPDGHAEKGLNELNRLSRAMRRAMQDCRDEWPKGSCPSNEEILQKSKEAAELLGTAAIVYLIVSEGTRVIPQRNLIPIP